MPAPLHFAHRRLERLAALRKGRRDAPPAAYAKAQVTVRYVDGVPVDANTVVVSHQHAPGFEKELPELVRGVVAEVLPTDGSPCPRKILVNPSGSFVQE